MREQVETRPEQRRAPLAAGARHVPSIWSFLVVDAAGFAILFAIFLIERVQQADAFSAAADRLDARFGLANTLILLTSGVLVAQAMECVRHADGRAARRWVATALAIGAAFALVKVSEYHSDFSKGILPWSGDFFSFYFIITGIHFIHYLVGMAVLIVIYHKLGKGALDDDGFAFVESSILYWHLVDLIWIAIFPIIYFKYIS
tara:strand:- start:9722 stop:10330 length:609 start_codon:yes stop_codon:yes gene_type:complete